MNDITQAIPLPLTATDASGTAWKQNYVYGALGERISISYLPSADAGYDWEPLPGSSGAAPNTPGKTLYYLSDALGSALALPLRRHSFEPGSAIWRRRTGWC